MLTSFGITELTYAALKIKKVLELVGAPTTKKKQE